MTWILDERVGCVAIYRGPKRECLASISEDHDCVFYAESPGGRLLWRLKPAVLSRAGRCLAALLDQPPPEPTRYPSRVENALGLILPLARGYAAEHPVGSNQRYIEEAEAALAELLIPTRCDGSPGRPGRVTTHRDHTGTIKRDCPPCPGCPACKGGQR